MDYPKGTEANHHGGFVVEAARMGDSTPAASHVRPPQGGNLIPPPYPLAPQPGFQAALPGPQSIPQAVGGQSGPVPAPIGFKAPYPPSSQGSQENAYPLTPPAYNPPAYVDDDTNAAQNVGEDGEFKLFDFTEKSIRRAFIRKVYGILMCQLLISLSFIALFLFCEPIKKWAAENLMMFYTAIIVYFAMALSMICCGELRRKAPLNFIFLGVFTLATSYMLGVATSCLDADLVMIAVGITAAVVLALTLFAFQTKYDFTGMGGGLLCALVILILFGCICGFMPNRTMDTLYASAGALIFSLYIIYDTQIMLGGNHKYNITPEEYIFAALNLYLDIINLFLRILYLLARR